MGTSLVSSMGSTCPYDVGDILQTTNSKNPSERWNNTEWSQINGKFLLGTDDNHAIGSTGGNFSITQTEAQMPKHNHHEYGQSGDGNNNPIVNTTKTGNNAGTYQVLSWTNDKHEIIITGDAGNSQPMDITPYLAVYIWQRTA